MNKIIFDKYLHQLSPDDWDEVLSQLYTNSNNIDLYCNGIVYNIKADCSTQTLMIFDLSEVILEFDWWNLKLTVNNVIHYRTMLINLLPVLR